MEYFIALKNKQEGPFQIEDLKKLTFDQETLIWREGMTEWLKISELEELKEFIKFSEPIAKKQAPPPLPPKIKSDNLNDRELLLNEQRLKRQVTKVFFEKDKERIFRFLRTNTNVLRLIIPLWFISYLILAYWAGGFTAYSLKDKYKDFLKPNLIVTYKNYDSLTTTQKQQVKIESEIEDLMNDHENENELTPTMYKSLSESHSEMNKKWPGVTYGFKEGTVVLNYNQFLDDRINAAFGFMALLKTLGISIIISILAFYINVYVTKRKAKYRSA